MYQVLTEGYSSIGRSLIVGCPFINRKKCIHVAFYFCDIYYNDISFVLTFVTECARSRSIVTGDPPDCLENGNYNPVQCRRGICRCVDENGNQVVDEEVTEVFLADIDELPCALNNGLTTITTTTDPAVVAEMYIDGDFES